MPNPIPKLEQMSTNFKKTGSVVWEIENFDKLQLP